jgi:ATP-binding cassette subfamily F protein 3
MPSIDALIGALKQYEGTLLFVSHDVHFIRALASSVLHISAGKLTPYAGDYQYYLEKSGSQSERAALIAPGNYRPEAEAPAEESPRVKMGMREIKEQRRAEAELRKAANKLARESQARLRSAEEEIAQLESRQRELVAELETPGNLNGGRAFGLNRELAIVQERLSSVLEEWEKLSASLPAVEEEKMA